MNSGNSLKIESESLLKETLFYEPEEDIKLIKLPRNKSDTTFNSQTSSTSKKKYN